MLLTLVWALVNTFEYLEACIILSATTATATTTGNNHSAAATTDATRGERFIKTMQLKGLKCNSCHILHLPHATQSTRVALATRLNLSRSAYEAMREGTAAG